MSVIVVTVAVVAGVVVGLLLAGWIGKGDDNSQERISAIRSGLASAGW